MSIVISSAVNRPINSALHTTNRTEYLYVHKLESDHVSQPSRSSMSMFGHNDSVIIYGGAFTQYVAPSLSQIAFAQLTEAAAPAAFHNSGERFDPPKCHPRTRLAVTERIMNWILGKESTNELIMWFYGPAGAGKSAIAQRIAKLCHDANCLLASFFCSRLDPRRNCAKYLVPTISYQIACAFPQARALIEQEIARDPLVFTRSLETQIVKLMINPLRPLIDSSFFADLPSSPRLIILDGLDEVVDRQEQTRVLQTIADVLRQNQIPLIFLIVSRPEQEISYEFSTRPLAELTTRLVLDGTFHPDKDIRIFLDDSFSEIKVSHPRKNYISPSWPSSRSVDRLVYKSSGQFIYASTVIRFVKSLRHRPTERLDIILGLRPVHRDLPFAELDALYMHILLSLEHPDRTLQIIGAILVRDYEPSKTLCTIRGLEQFLGLESGDIELYLADMSSLVSWDPEGTEPVRILHASFGDFLFDPSRSGKFAIDRRIIENMMTRHCLRHLIFASSDDLPEEYWWDQIPEYAIRNVASHLSRSAPSADLKDYLQKLSFEHLFENIRIYCSKTGQTDYFFYRISRNFWASIFALVTSIQVLGLDQSEYYDLRHRLFDQVIKRDLESYPDSRHPSLNLLFCLRLRSDIRVRNCISVRWNEAAKQLTDWEQEVSVSRLELFPLNYYPPLPIISREFLQDASRAGRYAVDAEAYARASLSCLKYLSRFRLGAPINFHHTPRNLARRRNSPWHWRQHMKLIAEQPILDNFRYDGFPKKKYYCLNILRDLWYKSRHLRERAQRRQMYLDATHLTLVFLRRALPRSARSDELVAFVNAKKLVSQRALQFPAKLKKCKAAITTYVARVQQQSGAQSNATSV